MSFPDTCIRGILNKDYLLSNGLPDSKLFKEFQENDERTDDYMELSINWQDDDLSLKLILEEKRKDSDDIRYKAGAAIISRDEIDRMCRRPQIEGCLKYERWEIEGNKYHGNLLLKKITDKPLRNLIASSLALCVETVIPPESED